MKIARSKKVIRGGWCNAGTIVETLVSILVIGITGAGLLGVFASGFIMIRLTRENQRATQIMLEKFETLRLYSWDQINTAGFIPATFTAAYDPQDTSGQPGVTYSGRVVITNWPTASNYSDSMRQISVTVSWTSSGQIAHQRSVTTCVAKDGLQNYVY